MVCPKLGHSLAKTGEQTKCRTLAGLNQLELADLIGVKVEPVVCWETALAGS